MSVEGMGPYLTVEGATTSVVFEAHVEQVLVPTLRSGQVVVMDNLSAHKGERAKEMIEQRGSLAALTVFFFLANWNSFLWPLTITTNENLWMIQVAIASFQTQYAGAWNYIMAAATVAAIPTMALFFVFQRQLVESIKTSGFK
jgi:hypothetical protein